MCNTRNFLVVIAIGAVALAAMLLRPSDGDLNPQPEPPGVQLNPQPEPPGSDLNPQPEPPGIA